MAASDIEVKELEKRASGQAFELILSLWSKESVPGCPLSPPKEKDLSLEEIQKRLEAAEEKCKSHEAEVLKQLAEKQEHEKEELQKATEENDVRKMAEERLTLKTEAGEENQKPAQRTEGQAAAKPERLREEDKCTAAVRKNKGPKDPARETEADFSVLRTGFLPIPFLNIQRLTGQCHFTFALLTNILQADVGLYR